MNRIVIILISLVVLLPFLSLATDQKKESDVELKTFADKISYVLGQEVGGGLKNSPTNINLELFMRGLKDSLDDQKSLVDPDEAIQIKQEFTRQYKESQAKIRAEISQKNQQAESVFMAENKNKEGVVTTESGLQYMVLKKGDGSKPTRSDTVTVHYRGALLDGTEFDSSYERDQPATFQVAGVIAGWTEALQLMNVGSKFRLFIPSKLAYGKRGAGGKIGPNEMLIFDVELLEIKK
jgi:FKBP-type peptidyl-prolyl cis-trans isomerase FklB